MKNKSHPKHLTYHKVKQTNEKEAFKIRGEKPTDDPAPKKRKRRRRRRSIRVYKPKE